MLFKVFLKLKKNNKGYSLVEVIVAMLILSIVTVSLLAGFNVVSNSNVKTRKQQYANTVATNVLEALKQFGIEETALQMHSETTNVDFKLISNIAAGNYGESLNDFETKLVYGAPIDPGNSLAVESCLKPYPGNYRYQFLPRNAIRVGDDAYNNNYLSKYYFYINDVKEGTMSYDVQITFDASQNSLPSIIDGNDVNYDFGLSNLNTLNSNKTALIAPSGVWYTKIVENNTEKYDTSKTFETEAYKAFVERYAEYQNYVYNRNRNVAKLTNEAVRKAYDHYRTDAQSNFVVNSFNNHWANFLFVSSDIGVLDKTPELHGSTGKVTEDDVTKSIQFRTEAYNYYTTNYKEEWETEYKANGVVLDPAKTIFREDIDEIEKPEPLEKIVQKSQEDHATDPSKPVVTFEQVVMERIARVTVVEIKWDAAANAYKVSSRTDFLFDETCTDPYDTNKSYRLFCDEDDPERAEKIKYVGSGYFSRTFTTLENIYIFQDAARTWRFKSDTVFIDTFGATRTEMVSGVNEEGIPFTETKTILIQNAYEDGPYKGNAEIGLYLIWQYQVDQSTGAFMKPDYSRSEVVNIVFGDSTVNAAQAKQFKVYTKDDPVFERKLQTEVNGAINDAAELVPGYDALVADFDNKDRAYFVTVNVLEHGTDNVVYTTSTTIKD